jgi:NitT/TauT family transport system ATP-binding protein
MKQRVAVIGGIISRPDLLLMDEPFGALDYSMREHLQNELLELWPSSGAAVVFVTHDIDEAVLLCDRVLVLRGSPGELAAEVAVDLPRPRQIDSPEFLATRLRIRRAGCAS